MRPHVYAITRRPHRHRRRRADCVGDDRDPQRVIESVGGGVAVPADAVVIDGAGMTVYPGPDRHGQHAPADTSSTCRSRTSVRTTDEARALEARRRSCRPQARAAEPSRSMRRSWRGSPAAASRRARDAAGRRHSGQSALVNVAAPPDEPQIGNSRRTAPRRSIVVKSPVALHVAFPDGRARRRRLSGVADGRDRVRAPGVPRRAALAASRSATQTIDRRWPGRHYDPALDAHAAGARRPLPVAFEATRRARSCAR